MGFQYKGGAAPLAKGGKTTTGDRPLQQGAAVGLRHKLHQFPTFRKGSANPVSLSIPTPTS
jgi:hypothetical protein